MNLETYASMASVMGLDFRRIATHTVLSEFSLRRTRSTKLILPDDSIYFCGVG
jgi:hypothetical protein